MAVQVAPVTLYAAVRCGAVCDPVLGDNGKLYVPKELVALYRDSVVPLADIVTPNQFECEYVACVLVSPCVVFLCLCVPVSARNAMHDLGSQRRQLSGKSISTVQEGFAACDVIHATGPRTVVVTSSSLSAAGTSTLLMSTVKGTQLCLCVA